jgi:predicted DNA-binding transcriptional regulator YafY
MQRNQQVRRLLSIMGDLSAAPRGLLVDDLARRYGVARRTVERDLAGLSSLGHAVETVPDEQSPRLRKRLNGATGLGGEAVSAAELAAARAAGRALSGVAAGPVVGAFNILLDKLEQAQPPSVRVDAAALGNAMALVSKPAVIPAAKAAILSALQEAILACAELRITYCKSGGTAVRDYIARPYGILFGGRNYLVWRGEDGGYRKFTLGRIEAVAPTGSHFIMDEDFSMEDYALQSVGVMSEPTLNVDLYIPAAAAGVLHDFSFHPTQSAAKQDDGGLLISFRAAGVEDICTAIFACGAPVRVLAPDKLAAAYKARLQAALAACS